jgi:hypothetical protein
MSKEMKRGLEKVTDIPVDIWPRFKEYEESGPGHESVD